MKKVRKYIIDENLLKRYYPAALQNAKLLLEESNKLLGLKSYARSYFLACASIEEIGKALMAFSGLGRNLNNPGTQSSLKKAFEDHSAKIPSAFGVPIFSLNPDEKPNDTKKFLLKFLDLCLSLEMGREKSMYVDFSENGEISIPNHIVSERNAEDTLRLSTELFSITKKYVLENEPPKISEAQDQLAAIPTRKLSKMMQCKNFLEFCVEKISETDKVDSIELMLAYYQQYFSKGKSYNPKKELL